MLYPAPSDARQALAYVVALPSAAAVGYALYRLLAVLRRGGLLARFVARVWIIGGFYLTLAGVMAVIAGPYVFAGRSRGGQWHTEPMTPDELWALGAAAGIVGALIWPAVARQRGGPDM